MAKFRVWADPSIEVSVVVDAKDEDEAVEFVYDNYNFDDLLEGCGLPIRDIEYDIVGVDRDDVSEED